MQDGIKKTPLKDLFEMVVVCFNVCDNVNIGDKYRLKYSPGTYYLVTEENKIVGRRVYLDENTHEYDNFLDFIATKLSDKKTCIMTDEDNFFDEAKVKVIAVTKELIAAVIEKSYKDRWYDEFDIIEDDMDEAEFQLESFEYPAVDFEELLFNNLGDIVADARNEIETVEKKEEKKDMFSELGNSFGKINSNQFRISINGLTVRNKEGKYVTFNPETRELIEVTSGFFDDMKDLLFLMPTAELEVGDIILHQGKPYYITSVRENGIKGIDFEDAVESILIPKTNVFGIKYYTKVFNCLGTNNILGSDLTSNPMMAYALMGGKDFDLSKVMMFQALSGQNDKVADFSENPIMLMALMSNEKGGGDLSDFAKMQMLSQLATPKKRKTKEAKEN